MEQIQELITRVINGDTQAFEEIYQATYRQVYYTAFSFLKNEQNTLDVMQIHTLRHSRICNSLKTRSGLWHG